MVPQGGKGGEAAQSGTPGCTGGGGALTRQVGQGGLALRPFSVGLAPAGHLLLRCICSSIYRSAKTLTMSVFGGCGLWRWMCFRAVGNVSERAGCGGFCGESAPRLCPADRRSRRRAWLAAPALRAASPRSGDSGSTDLTRFTFAAGSGGGLAVAPLPATEPPLPPARPRRSGSAGCGGGG